MAPGEGRGNVSCHVGLCHWCFFFLWGKLSCSSPLSADLLIYRFFIFYFFLVGGGHTHDIPGKTAALDVILYSRVMLCPAKSASQVVH